MKRGKKTANITFNKMASEKNVSNFSATRVVKWSNLKDVMYKICSKKSRKLNFLNNNEHPKMSKSNFESKSSSFAQYRPMMNRGGDTFRDWQVKSI